MSYHVCVSGAAVKVDLTVLKLRNQSKNSDAAMLKCL